MSAGTGQAGVVAEAVSGVGAEIASARAAADGEIVDLFPLPGCERGVNDGAARERAIDARKRGRPPGAANKSTKDLREYLLRRGVNPLQAMMEWALHTPESLAAELGCTRLEAFDRLAGVWRELAPYFAAKMVPVDDEGRPLPMFAMQFGVFGGRPETGGQAPWLYLQNQGLGDAASALSHGEPSHGAENASESNGMPSPSR
jgi:hypothetical protein